MAAGKDIGALVGQIGADIRQWEKAHQQIIKDINRMETKGKRSAMAISAAFNRAGSRLKSTGRSLTRSLTLPIAGAATAAVKFGADFESSMTRIETLVGIGRKQVQGMRKDLLDISSATGRGPKELAEALFTVTSAGLRGSEAMSVLEKASKASAVGLGETRSIAQALTGILQSYSKMGLQAAEATDTLIGIVREGNLEASELAPTLGRVTGIASQLGISFKEIGANIASFTRLGVDSAEAVTGLRGIMNAFLQQTPKSVDALKSIGSSFEEVTASIRKDGLAQALVGLVESFEGNERGLSALFGNVRGLSAVLGTAGAQTKSYLQIVKNLTSSQGNLSKGFARVSETIQFKFNQALADLQEAGIKAGTKIFPIVEKMINKLASLAQSFADMSEESRTRLLKLAGVLAIGGPVLTVMGHTATAISGMIKLFSTLSTVAIPAVTKALETGYIRALYAAETATAAFLAKAAAITLPLAAITAGAVKITRQLGSVKEGFDKVRNTNIAGASVKQLEERITNIKQTLAEIQQLNNQSSSGFGGAGQLERIKELRTELDKTRKALADLRPKIFKTPGQVLDNLGLGLGQLINNQNTAPSLVLTPTVTVDPKVEGNSGGEGSGVSEAVTAIYQELQTSLNRISSQAQVSNFFPDFNESQEKIDAIRGAMQQLLSEGIRPTSTGFQRLATQMVNAMRQSVSSVQRVKDIAIPTLSDFATQGDKAFKEMNKQLEILSNRDKIVPDFDLAAAKIRLYTQTLTQLADEGYGDNILQVQKLQKELKSLLELQEDSNEKTEEGTKFGQQFGQTFTSSLEEAIMKFDDLGDVVSGFFNDLARLLIRTQITSPLFSSLFGEQGSGGIFGKFLNNTFGGARAMGGPVMAGRSYVVGERRPELFTPSQSGSISSRVGAGGGEVTINVINKNGSSVDVQKRKTAGGGMDIGIIIDQRVKDGLNKGRYDKEFASNLNVRRGG